MRYRDFWLSLNPDPFVMGVLRDGYRLPFREGVIPEAYREKNNKTALENLPFLRSHVASLVSDTTVEEVPFQPLCCSPLTVSSRYVDCVLRLRMCSELTQQGQNPTVIDVDGKTNPFVGQEDANRLRHSSEELNRSG